MQHCSCRVFLSGNRNHVVDLPDVSVAEIEVLRALHGHNAITDVNPHATKRGPAHNSKAELARLRAKYRRRVQTSAQAQGNIVDMVYRGPRPQIPTTLADIGLDWKGAEKKTNRKKSDAEQTAEETADETLME